MQYFASTSAIVSTFIGTAARKHAPSADVWLPLSDRFGAKAEFAAKRISHYECSNGKCISNDGRPTKPSTKSLVLTPDIAFGTFWGGQSAPKNMSTFPRLDPLIKDAQRRMAGAFFRTLYDNLETNMRFFIAPFFKGFGKVRGNQVTIFGNIQPCVT